MKVAMFSSKPYDRTYFDEFNGARHEIVYLEPHLNEQTVALAEGAKAVCCFVNDTVSAEVLQRLHEMGVELVALRCAGFNNVDLEQARALGITVCRVPEYSPYAVAEHTAGLILVLNRNIHRAFSRVRESDYSLNGLLGFDLHGKTVGVVGTGKIGVAFCNIMLGFGCKVLAFDPLQNEELKGRVTYVGFDELCAQADIVSLHCPLTPETYHLINADSMARMKRGVMIINTSRGGLIDTKVVITGLKSGQIGHLGLDVYEEEGDLFFEDMSNQVMQDDVFARLTTFPNVVVTGHQAFFTREALQKIAQVTLANLDAFERQDGEGLSLVI